MVLRCFSSSLTPQCQHSCRDDVTLTDHCATQKEMDVLTSEMAIKTGHSIDLNGVFRRSGTACKLPCHRNGPRFDARPAKRTGLSFFGCSLLPLIRAFQAHEVTAIRNGDQVVVLQFPQASNTVGFVGDVHCVHVLHFLSPGVAIVVKMADENTAIVRGENASRSHRRTHCGPSTFGPLWPSR